MKIYTEILYYLHSSKVALAAYLINTQLQFIWVSYTVRASTSTWVQFAGIVSDQQTSKVVIHSFPA